MGILVAVTAIGCTEEEGSPGPLEVATSSPTTTTTLPQRPADGSLRIGVLLPTTGPAASIGQPIIESLQAEVTRINTAGGVLGRAVTLVARDEGTSIASAALAVDSLLQEDAVDAIIGPLSSTTALGVIGRAVAGGVVTCSPSASAIALDEYPDNGLFFRTIPSDTVLAGAIVKEAQDTGKSTMTIVYVDDPYGRSLEAAVVAQAALAGLAIIESIGIAATDEEIVDRLGPAIRDSEMVVVVADTETATRALTAFDQILGDGPVPDIFVNDQVRLARTSPSIIDLGDGLRDKVVGIAHQVVVEGEPASIPFVAHAIDCLGLIALAAEVAETDQPLAIASQISPISTGGRPCRDFISCKDVIDTGLQIDYDGATGLVNISARTGDQTRGRFETFRFVADGTEQQTSVFEYLLR